MNTYIVEMLKIVLCMTLSLLVKTIYKLIVYKLLPTFHLTNIHILHTNPWDSSSEFEPVNNKQDC